MSADDMTLSYGATVTAPIKRRRQITTAVELTWRATFDACLSLAAERGLTAPTFLKSSEHRSHAGRPDQRIPLDVLARLLNWGAEASGDQGFGLKAGARVRIHDLGAYGYALLNSATVGDAMKLARRFADFQQQGAAFDWRRAGAGHIEMTYDARGLKEPWRRQDAECTLATVHAVMEQLTGGLARPVEVRVQHAAPKAGPRLEDHFLCHCVYGDSDNALRYETTLLRTPIKGSDPKLLDILVACVEQDVRALPPHHDELGKVRGAIRKELPSGRARIDVVARRCRVAERTLQRRLAARGLSFSGLVDHIRRDIYRELQAQGIDSHQECATALGFSDASALAKARRRWDAQASGSPDRRGTYTGT